MSTAIATPEPAKVVPAFANPLDVTAELAGVEHHVNRYIDSVVTGIEDEIKYQQRRREVAAAVRRVHALRQDMQEVVQTAELTGPALAAQQLDVLRGEMIVQFGIVNRGAGSSEQIAAVDALVKGFRDQVTEAPKKGRGKSSGG